MTLSKKDEERMKTALLEHGKAEIFRKVQGMDLRNVTLLSIPQVCGLLDCTPAMLKDMKIPRIDLRGTGAMIRYRLSDVEQYLEKQKEAVR